MTYTVIPYVIAYANEVVNDPIWFEPYADELRLAYVNRRSSDWVHGVLRARVRDLRDNPKLRGHERMKHLNTKRQWRCMDQLLCQVCGKPAIDGAGRFPWLLTKTAFERTGPDSGRTNAPPTCWTCQDKALAECPMLRDNHTRWTVASATSAGVLADLYEPGEGGMFFQPTLIGHNVFIDWDAHRDHAQALATAHIVHLHGMQPHP